MIDKPKERRTGETNIREKYKTNPQNLQIFEFLVHLLLLKIKKYAGFNNTPLAGTNTPQTLNSVSISTSKVVYAPFL